ncbi:nucleoside triphosphate hydrolase [Aestuariivirga sp.]|uniref:nucleoside triphosphate hydrolase n=1 Tax=Aestuariivirga sp. TaxID=2650926 RepID=UPI0039E3CD66
MEAVPGFTELVSRIRALEGSRVIVAVAGPPGAGKSTLAEALAASLGKAEVIPMDGFHYDDAVLNARGLLSRKGSPPTFDALGLRHLLMRLRANDESEVAIPVFDRDLEISRAGARIVPASTRILIVEGNYLLLRQAPWESLAPFFGLTVMLREPRDVIERRLMARWFAHGFDEAGARAKVEGNDMPNADLVLTQSRAADVELSSQSGNSGSGKPSTSAR